METFEQPLNFYLEEITSVEDFDTADIIAETEMVVKELLTMDYGYMAKVKYNNMF